jgi:hypothetical protein
LAWLLSHPTEASSSECCGAAPRAALLPPPHQHRLILALAAWMEARPCSVPLSPVAAKLLELLALQAAPSSGGARAAARLVLSVHEARAAAPSEVKCGAWGSAMPFTCEGLPGPAPMPAWLQRQSLLLAQATGSWGVCVPEAEAPFGTGVKPPPGEQTDQPSLKRESGLAGSWACMAVLPNLSRRCWGLLVPAPAASKRASCHTNSCNHLLHCAFCAGLRPDAEIVVAASERAALAQLQQQPQGQQPQGQQPQGQQPQGQQPQGQQPQGQQPPAGAAVDAGDPLGPFLQQLSALASDLDEASLDWALLEQAAPWTALAGGSDGWGPPPPRALEAREALARLPLDATRLLCQRLAADGSHAVAAGCALRWAAAPQVAALADVAPQALLECLLGAGERVWGRAGVKPHATLFPRSIALFLCFRPTP